MNNALKYILREEIGNMKYFTGSKGTKETPEMGPDVNKVSLDLTHEEVGKTTSAIIMELAQLNTKRKQLEKDFSALKPELKSKIDELILPTHKKITKILKISFDTAKTVELTLSKEGEQTTTVDYGKVLEILKENFSHLEGFNETLTTALQASKVIKQPNDRSLSIGDINEEQVFESVMGLLRKAVMWFESIFNKKLDKTLYKVKMLNEQIKIVLEHSINEDEAEDCLLVDDDGMGFIVYPGKEGKQMTKYNPTNRLHHAPSVKWFPTKESCEEYMSENVD